MVELRTPHLIGVFRQTFPGVGKCERLRRLMLHRMKLHRMLGESDVLDRRRTPAAQTAAGSSATATRQCESVMLILFEQQDAPAALHQQRASGASRRAAADDHDVDLALVGNVGKCTSASPDRELDWRETSMRSVSIGPTIGEKIRRFCPHFWHALKKVCLEKQSESHRNAMDAGDSVCGLAPGCEMRAPWVWRLTAVQHRWLSHRTAAGAFVKGIVSSDVPVAEVWSGRQPAVADDRHNTLPPQRGRDVRHRGGAIGRRRRRCPGHGDVCRLFVAARRVASH